MDQSGNMQNRRSRRAPVLLAATLEVRGVPTPVNELLQRMAGRAARDGTAPGSISPDELIQMLPDGE